MMPINGYIRSYPEPRLGNAYKPMYTLCSGSVQRRALYVIRVVKLKVDDPNTLELVRIRGWNLTFDCHLRDWFGLDELDEDLKTACVLGIWDVRALKKAYQRRLRLDIFGTCRTDECQIETGFRIILERVVFRFGARRCYLSDHTGLD